MCFISTSLHIQPHRCTSTTKPYLKLWGKNNTLFILSQFHNTLLWNFPVIDFFRKMLSLRFSYARGNEEKLTSKINKIQEIQVLFCCSLKNNVSQGGKSQTTQIPKPQQ